MLFCVDSVFHAFLGEFAKLQKATINFVGPFVHLLHGTTRLLLNGFSWNLILPSTRILIWMH